MHRDVSEESDKELLSVSLGCDGVFVIGLEDENCQNTTSLVIRLHSGDAVIMGGLSRFAWHGVPKIVSDTCPDYLSNWPATSDSPANEFEDWRGWMSNKRVNLNIRQVHEL